MRITVDSSPLISLAWAGQLGSGRVTLRDFARALRLDIWAAHDLLRAEGVAVAQGDRAETEGSLRAMLDELAVESD
ncbi:hypothetical protein JQS43_09050 [Natronosporangium hydrolyticum]|uniref:Uncharacterized protein n=1 Tax=Natronosporangium hydrolyticum TaxID=2811111 RepID=A0A895YEW9_9ACTN|nr:hypothetical protein [Natronosporangium hydrolyticum]QSB16404.1 hypothetical protein JQS43_09050 [Natronosporangium hydrolyticum]